MKILIVEDEYDLADAIATTLKYNNYLVDIKTDGFETLKDLRKEKMKQLL